MHDPRMDPHLGVAYSADPTPGRHTITAASYYNTSQLWEHVSWAPAVTKPYPRAREYEASAEEAMKSAAGVCVKQVLDAAGGCLFALMTGLSQWRLFDWLDAATGWKRSPDDYIEAGRRIQTLRQLFNLRQGLDPRDSIMKGRLRGDPPLAAGPLAGIALDIDGKVSAHWKAMGWDGTTGRPTSDTLKRLGIEEFGPPRPGASALAARP
jgi:aldehyde:ferredoxin oxidoreductase